MFEIIVAKIPLDQTKPYFRMDPLSKLHTLLTSYLNGIDGDVQDLYYELVAKRDSLRQLFDMGPRNPAEKSRVQSGESRHGSLCHLPKAVRQS